jgi:hypothetical protein
VAENEQRAIDGTWRGPISSAKGNANQRSNMQSIAWASCFLKAPDAVYEALSELGAELRNANVELVLFGSAGDYSQYRGFRHVSVPFLLADQGRTFANLFSVSGLPMASSGIAELLEIDRVWGSRFYGAEAHLYVLRALAFWERAFEIMQPSVVVGWGSTAPLSRLHVRLAQQRQRPAYILERGPLENTLTLSLSGQTALTSVNTFPSLISAEIGDARLVKRWNSICSYYQSLSNRHYPSTNRAATPEEEASLQSDPRPRVLYFGTHDVGSGCTLSGTPLGDCYAPWVSSSEQAARLVAEALKSVAPKGSLWIKPHPAVTFRIGSSAGPEIVRHITDLDVHYLVGMADVCVTLASTTQVLAIIAGCPLVTLGNGYLMGRDIAYEVRTPSDVAPMLEMAVRRQGWGVRLEQGQALVATMFERDLFGLTQEVPTELKMKHMATLFSRFSHYRKIDLAPVVERIRAFEILRTTTEDHAGAAVRERDEAKVTLGAVTRERDEAKVTLETVIRERDEAMMILDAVTRERNEARLRLDAMLSSTSWRVTAPLRKLVELSMTVRKKTKYPPVDLNAR